jgi:phosphoesterase RecJ-like protein
MSQGTTPLAVSTREAVIAKIRAGERFVLVSHEHPDGDALGSLVAMQATLRALGKDSVVMIPAAEFPLPQEYRSFVLDGLCTESPQNLDGVTAIFLDCGNIDRITCPALREVEPLLNIDHHHDNTRFGTVNHVVEEASCTAELVWDLLPGLGVPLTPVIAEALYIGLVTDTGRFSYENTTPRAHRMAGELLAAGVDPAAAYRQIYEACRWRSSSCSPARWRASPATTTAASPWRC